LKQLTVLYIYLGQRIKLYCLKPHTKRSSQRNVRLLFLSGNGDGK